MTDTPPPSPAPGAGDPVEPRHGLAESLPADVERDLVDRARGGEQEALGLLYDAYLPRLYRYCLSRVGNETDAEDLAEEIFLKVMRSLPTFKWQPAGRGAHSGADSSARIPFGAWLFRIAHNHVISFHRRAATRGQPAELSETIRDERRGPQELTETKIAIEEVFAAVRQLPDAQRDVILLRFASGLSVAETAAVLDKQQTNVKVLQHKGVQRLKRLLLEAAEPTRIRTR